MDRVREILRGNSSGIGLIEVIIALAILGIIAAAFLGGLFTSLKSVAISEERSVAVTLAQSQMEYIKGLTYEEGASPSYEQIDVPSPDYPDYIISVDAPPIDPNTGSPLANPGDDMGIQKITITVSHQDSEVFTLEDYKVNR